MRRFFLAAVAIAVGMSGGAAQSKETVTYAYLLDPALEGVLYAINEGIVTSDEIEIDATALAIPALIQSTPTKRFDVIMNAVMAIPQAKRRGLDLVVLSSALRAPDDSLGAGIWVKKDSPYQSVEDIKGKTIGNYALQSTGTTWIRIALWKAHGMDVSYEDGDFNWVQIPAPALLTALEEGRVDAATLIHAQAFKARETGNYRSLAWTNQDLEELFGVNQVAAVNVTYPEKLEERPEAFKEFNRMLRESALYAMNNIDEVGAAISEDTDISPEFFRAWMTRFSSFPAAVSDGDVEAMEVVWRNATEMGIIDEYPDPEDVIWEHAIRE